MDRWPGVYGARKVWKQLNREMIPVGRWTVERLMKRLGLEGIRRGRRCRTTIASDRSDKPLDIFHSNPAFQTGLFGQAGTFEKSPFYFRDHRGGFHGV